MQENGCCKRKCNSSHVCTISYTCKIWLMVAVCMCLVASAAVLIYFLLAKNGSETTSKRFPFTDRIDFVSDCPTKYVPLTERFDCYPEDSYVNRELCEARGCCFLDNYVKEEAYNSPLTRCVYPQNYGYMIKKQTTMENGFELSLQRLSTPSRYGDDIQVVSVLVEKQTPYRLRIKFYDPISDHYEVPTPKISIISNTHQKDTALYSVDYNESGIPFSLQVQRQVSRTTLFDTSLSGLTLSHHFLELTTKLPSEKVFGFSRHNANQFLENSKSWPLFANPSLKGVHPMYMCVENDGKAHGLLLLNSNAMEVKTFTSVPAMTFRTIGGVLDFYLFLGPTPEDVIKQYTEAIGRPALPPYWALGMHTGNEILNSIEAAESTLQNWINKDIPMEALHLNLDVHLLDSKKLKKLKNFILRVKDVDQHKLILSLAPYMKVNDSPNSAYKSAMKRSVFLMEKYGSPFFGLIDANRVAYIDFGSPSGLKWLTELLKIYFSYVSFDGISMINNSPLNEIEGGINGCLKDDLNIPPYIPSGVGQSLYSKTICMDAIQQWNGQNYQHYYLHNLYGLIMASTTHKVLDELPDDQRKLLMSQSTFPGSGIYGGHWIEPKAISWSNLEASVQLIADYNLYGIPLVGIKLCQSNDYKIEDDKELILRWIQLGAFFPLNGIFNCTNKTNYTSQQDNEFYKAVKHTIFLRYQLLPYLYTLFYEAHINGKTIFKMLWHEFPQDNVVFSIKNQFMWGSSLLISPVMLQGAKHLQYYLPEGIWYNFYTGDIMISHGEWFNETLLSFNNSNLPMMFIRAGHTLVLQQPANTIEKSRKNPMKLVVALNFDLTAQGILYLDDGSNKDSISLGEYVRVKFTVENNTLSVNTTGSGKFNTAYIDHVQIMGLEANPKKITGDNNYVVTSKHWNTETKVLGLNLIIRLEGNVEIKWE